MACSTRTVSLESSSVAEPRKEKAMSYFPESVMPSRLKDESQDVNGNKYVIGATDANKHDEEIKAIEKVIGVRRPSFPGQCYSAASSGFSTATGFSSITGFSAAPGCYPAPSGCAGATNNLMDAIQDIFNQLSLIRSGMVLVTSGTVSCRNDVLGGATGTIVFPTNWPITTLVDYLPNTTVEELAPTASNYVTLADVSDMPEIGYITIINDASNLLFYDIPDAQRIPSPTNVIGPTSMAQEDAANYEGFSGFSGFAGFSGLYYMDDMIAASGSSSVIPDYALDRLTDRISNGQSMNVEILFYSGIDVPNNRLLRVRRAHLGSTPTQHAPNDLVFKGRMAIHVSPTLVHCLGDDISQVECYLRSNGTIRTRAWTCDSFGGTWTEDGHVAYAQYQATLVRTLDEIPPLRPGEECD